MTFGRRRGRDVLIRPNISGSVTRNGRRVVTTGQPATAAARTAKPAASRQRRQGNVDVVEFAPTANVAAGPPG
jgi:hypothetical protein